MEEPVLNVKSSNLKLSKINNRYGKHNSRRVCQGDILKDVKFLEFVSFTSKKGRLFTYPYLIVISQDCDLESDFGRKEVKLEITEEETQDHKLHTILVCPAYDINNFKKGDHLKSQHIKMRNFPEKEIIKVKNNKEYERFHYLHEEVDLQIPELVIDFKHFYTIPRDIIYEQYEKSYLATMNILFRENLSQRFSNFLSRIGLPEVTTLSNFSSIPSN